VSLIIIFHNIYPQLSVNNSDFISSPLDRHLVPDRFFSLSSGFYRVDNHMRPLNHHLLCRNGIISFRIEFYDFETNRHADIEFSLETRDWEKARLERDFLCGSRRGRRSLRALKERFEALANVNTSESGGDLLNVQLRKRNAKSALQSMEDFLLNRKDIEGACDQAVDYYRICLETFLRFSGEPGIHITTDEAQKFADCLRTTTKGKWFLEDNIREVQSNPTKRLAIKTVHNVVINISTFYVWLIEKGRFAKANPFSSVDLPEVIPTKVRIKISPQIADSLCAVVTVHGFDNDEWFAAVETARRIGCRLGEALRIFGSDIDLTASPPTMRVRTLKQRVPTSRLLPIPTKLIDRYRVLKKKHDDGHLYPSLISAKEVARLPGRGPIGKWFARAWRIEAKKIEPLFDFHSWRKYATSEMANAKVPRDWYQHVIGHAGSTTADGGVTDLYVERDLVLMLEYLDRVR
jgi:integrase